MKKGNGFDLAAWLESSEVEHVLSSWDRERYTSLPNYRRLQRDVALAHGEDFVAAVAAAARGDAVRTEGLASRLLDEGAAHSCTPEEVVAAFEIFQRAHSARLAESALADSELQHAARQLIGALLGCWSALANALAARLADARNEVAKAEVEAQRLRADCAQVTALLTGEVDDVLATAMAGLASTKDKDDCTSPRVPVACEAIERLRDRTRRLREVARLEKGADLQKTRVRIRNVLGKVAGNWEEPARRRDIAIDLAADTSEVEADEGLLTQALEACLENALRFTPVGGKIRLAARRRADRVIVTMWDSGPPLHLDERTRAFDKYWTGNQESAAGRGLGLYLCRLVAEHHDGEAWTDDQQGCCAFHFALPLAAPE